MSDGLRFSQRVDRRMSAFLAGKKDVRRDVFALELNHNLGWEASHLNPAPSEAELEDARATLTERYARQLVNF